MARNRVIGVGNRLPWHLPQDLKRFRALTRGHPVIMGRKTHESIGKALPERLNLVITRNADYLSPVAPGQVEIQTSVEAAIGRCGGRAEEIFIIGGSEIYELAMPWVQRLYVTQVHQAYEGDSFFPEWPREFVEIEREDHLHGVEIPHSFLILERVERS
jgi:dihydrofolate reductase